MAYLLSMARSMSSTRHPASTNGKQLTRASGHAPSSYATIPPDFSYYRHILNATHHKEPLSRSLYSITKLGFDIEFLNSADTAHNICCTISPLLIISSFFWYGFRMGKTGKEGREKNVGTIKEMYQIEYPQYEIADSLEKRHVWRPRMLTLYHSLS